MHPKSASRHKEGVASVAFVARWTPTRPTRGVVESVTDERKPAPTRGRGGLVCCVRCRSRSEADAPAAEQDSKVGRIHGSVAIDVGRRNRLAVSVPDGEQDAEVGGVHDAVPGDVTEADLTDIRDAVAIGIGEGPVEDLSVVDKTVAVAVCGPFDHRGRGRLQRAVVSCPRDAGVDVKDSRVILVCSEFVVRFPGGPVGPVEGGAVDSAPTSVRFIG